MKISNQLELKFLKALKKQDSKHTKEELDNIMQRNSYIKKHFIIDDKVSQRLETLNDKLRIEEKRIFPFYRNL